MIMAVIANNIKFLSVTPLVASNVHASHIHISINMDIPMIEEVFIQVRI